MAEEKKEEAKKEDKKEEGKEEGKKEEGKDGAAPEGGEGGAATEGASPLSKKKKLIIIGVAALFALIVSGVGVFFVIRAQKTEAPEQVTTEGVEQGEEKEGAEGEAGEGEKAAESEAAKPIFVDMPEFLINLNSGGKQASFLKMIVVLDVPDEKSKLSLEANMPRIRDNFQIYLHELRAEDLKGSAGLQLLREELLLRVNKVIYPNKVNDILFKEILIQ